MKAVYVQAWEESERGWGTRPDGFWFYSSLEVAQQHTANELKRIRAAEQKDKPQGYVPDEYSRPLGEPRLVEVSKELYDEVMANKSIFRLTWKR
jgi:hypothetical protein